MKKGRTPYGAVIVGEKEALFRQAIELAEEHVEKEIIPRPSWAMAGGSTPKAFFDYCRESDALPERFIEHGAWYTSDERMLPTSSEESNFGNLDRLLLKHCNIPEENKYPWPTDMAPHEAAHVFNDLWNKQRGPAECFDICFLGIGDDCHTASLFPHSPLLANPVKENFASVEVPGKGYRLTITPHGLSLCGIIVVMAFGKSKAIPLQSILTSISQPDLRPAQILHQYSEKVVWLLDDAAAEKLDL